MKSIFEEAAQQEVLTRLQRVTPASKRRFGRMTAPQMVHHLNLAFEAYMGRLGMSFLGQRDAVRSMNVFAFFFARIFARISKFVTLSPIPIPRGVRIPRQYESGGDYDLDEERERFRVLLAEFVAKDDEWPSHIFLGPLTRDEYGKLTYKHIDHHLRQFSA